MPPFQKRDLIITAILGEIVGLFAYAIAKKLDVSISHNVLLMSGAIVVPIAAVALIWVAYMLGKKTRPVIFQFGKFAAVGFSNTAIDWGVLNLLLPAPGTSTVLFAGYKALSFGIATLNSFLWNRSWSFGKKGTEKIGKEAIQFYAVTAIGLVLNVAIATAMKALGPDTNLWARIVAPATGTAASMIWDFLAYRLIVFKAHLSPTDTQMKTPTAI